LSTFNAAFLAPKTQSALRRTPLGDLPALPQCLFLKGPRCGGKGHGKGTGKEQRKEEEGGEELPPKEKAILKLKLRFIVIVERSNDRMRSIVRPSCTVSGCIYLSFLVFVRKTFAFHNLLNICHYSSSVGSNISP